MSDKTGESLTDKANAAFRQAAVKVIERARQTGTPVIVCEEGRVVERTAEEMEQEFATEPSKKPTTRDGKSPRST